MKEDTAKKEVKEKQSPLDDTFEIAYELKKKVSVLIDNFVPNTKQREAYVGYPIRWDGDFVVLDMHCSQRLDIITIKKSFILSVWTYK